MTRLARQTASTPRQRNYLEKVELSANALLSIINDILDFSKIEAGMLALEEVDFSLDDVLETVSAATALRAEEKGLEVVYAVDPGVPSRLRGDPLRLGQVLTNLVGNAIKFTEHGEVVVSIHLVQSPALRLGITVRDTGIGLDETRAERLFQPFTQADTQTTRRYGGTGLGLAICHRLVQLMDGQISVSSVPGQGSSFRFSARVQPAMDPAPHGLPPGPVAGMEGACMLVVDDNASARETLGAMARRLGMRCDTAASGSQALRLLEKASRQGTPYALALLDWRMPVMDGLELARRMREQRHLATTPAVLMVTAFGRDEVLRHAEQLGLRGLLIKPVTGSVLLASLEEAMHSPGPGTRGAAADAGPHGAAPQPHYPGLPGRRVLVVDDNALNRELATELLQRAGMSVQAATDGRHALRLLAGQAFDAVLMDVHMPGMDGLRATRAIRARKALRHLPVIALTAQARTEDRVHIEAAGMNAHLTKPIDDVLLYETLQRCLAQAASPALHAEPPPAAPSTAAGPTGSSGTQETGRVPALPWDAARMRQRLAGQPPGVLHLIDGFVRDFTGVPQRLREGARDGHWEAVAALAHTLKGSLGYLGADLLVQWSAMAEAGAHAAASGKGAAPQAIADTQSLTQALADGLQALLADITVLGGQATRPLTLSPPQRHPGHPDEIPSTLARLRRQIADSDYAALAGLEQLRQLAGERHQPLVLRIQRLAEDLETDTALLELEQLAKDLDLVQAPHALLVPVHGSVRGEADA
jgi:CheY-like chemotaxis protein/HPt (histidine-containing phosphotransfer) domain-containing protein/anti-sigma regulatory factor (Ser/Thr protein kinase)